jgi:hypothetical protein
MSAAPAVRRYHARWVLPITRPALADATVVVDPFHIVRLANQAVTRARQRVQRATL